MTRLAGSPTTFGVWGCVAGLCAVFAGSVDAIDPTERTADMPDSWLVLYNASSAESFIWALDYIKARDIPASNMMGLSGLGSAPPERLETEQEAQDLIVSPVRDLFAANPAFEQQIMGIVVGYGVPGMFGHIISQVSGIPDVDGGFSVAGALQDMSDDGLNPFSQQENNWDNPHFFGNTLPPEGRWTKALLGSKYPGGSVSNPRYMTARMDAPSLEEALDLVNRAIALEQDGATLWGQNIWYDFFDASFPSSNGEWYWLEIAPDVPELQDLPWSMFDVAQDDPIPNDAFRFAVYKLFGWTVDDFNLAPPGSRVLAYHLTSFGGITARSLTSPSGGVFVPNVLAAGYASAIGATAEPGSLVGLFPDTILAGLGEGWTLGESFYLGNPFDDWVWTLFGDPLLKLPNWFNDMTPVPGDINADGAVGPQDMAGFSACLSGPDGSSDSVCETFDIDGDGDFDLGDFAEFQMAYINGGSLDPRDADFDGDGVVDLNDYAAYETCRTSSTPTSLGACEILDFDYDLDVDFKDFAQMQIDFE